MKRRTLMHFAACCAAISVAPFATAAEVYPSRSVEIIVPYAPGGATDTVARIVAEEMRKIADQPFVVQNKPGASGLIALDQLVRARPDGYTIMLGNVSTNSITPVLFRDKMAYNYNEAVKPLAMIAAVPAVLTSTNVDFEPRNMKELVEAAKKNPGEISYGSAGMGSAPHLSFLALEARTGTKFLHIPFKDGAGASITDTIRGDVKLNFLNIATAIPLISDGRLRPIVVSGNQRLAELPDTPTLAEENMEYMGGINWQGFFVPAGTPQPIIERLHEVIVKAVASDSVQKAFAAKHIPPVINESPEAFAEFVRKESETWMSLMQQGNLKLE